MLSKSDYLLYLKHPAWLWLKKHDEKKLPKISENTQAVFDRGHLFEKYAERLFPGGVTVGFSEDDFIHTYLDMPVRTKKALADGATTLFQGRFESGKLTCICDIIKVVGDNVVDLYEIKSSTKTKELHKHDLTFQRIVLEQAGYKVRYVLELHANKGYVRDGDIDVHQLIATDDLTDITTELRDETMVEAARAVRVMESSEIPDISPALVRFDGREEWMAIYESLTHFDAESIYALAGLNAKKTSELEELGIRNLRDIPASITLRPNQKRQVRAVKENHVIVDGAKIREFLAALVYPLYFLDYETLSCLVPEYDGTRPYEQIPFQYSLHILDRPDGELTHVGYLHADQSNPVEALSTSLATHIGPKGTVLAWHSNFEESRNTEMGEMAPEFQEFYRKVNRRMVDLKMPFSEGWYIDKNFFGSASIKHVLPVLIPELSYEDLEIREGNSAQRIWMETVLEGKHKEEREKIFHALDTYCALDTLAMVKIYEYLLKVAG